MTVFHGSDRAITNPDTLHSRKNVDFGPGFYVTPLLEQAKSWSRKFARRKGKAVVSRYALDEACFQSRKTLRFDAYNEAWLDFVLSCRRGLDRSDYEIVMGGVANDRVFDTIELLMNGLIDKPTALGRLRYEKPNYQICLRSQAVIDGFLQWLGSETL